MDCVENWLDWLEWLLVEETKQNDAAIDCEIEKLKKERAEKLEEFEEKLKELHEIKSDIKAIQMFLDRLERLKSKINE